MYAELHRVSKKELALKTLKIGLGRGDCSSDDILLELTIMSPTNAHKNIVLLQNFYIDPLSNKIVLAMDLMSCSLFDFIGRTEGRKLPEEHTLFVFNEVNNLPFIPVYFLLTIFIYFYLDHRRLNAPPRLSRFIP